MTASTELFDAIRGGDGARVRALIAADRGIVDRRNDKGHSPVLIAQYHNQHDIVALLLAAGPDLDIFDAASVGATARVAEVLARDPTLVNAYSGDGFFPLALAAFFGHLETVRLLLARGADPKAQNDAGKSPIGLAADKGNAAMLKLLKGVKT